MSLPRAAAATLARNGVSAATMAALDDQHHLLGDVVLETFADLVDELGVAPHELTPEHVARLRHLVGTRYLHAHHESWRLGRPTPGFWRDRSMRGVTGMAMPLGDLEERATPLVARVADAACEPDQPPPRGLLVASRNAHLGNYEGSFAVDVVPSALADALLVNAAEGRHHTLPGSIGEASGRLDEDAGVALVWEVQPNAWKPTAERNRSLNALWRRHRAWPLAAAVAALAWLLDRDVDVFVLDGSALRATHEVDPAAPLGDTIAALHDRTFTRAALALGRDLEPAATLPPGVLGLANARLAEELARRGSGAVLRRLR